MKRVSGLRVTQGKRILGWAALGLGLLWLGSNVRADDSNTSGAPASRAVRLSSVDGEVHLSQGNQVLADQAVANTPLFEGTRIDTGNDGRAEVQFEDGSVARVSPQSSLTLTVLRGSSDGGERDAEVQLNSGLGYFEIQGDSESNHIRVRFGDNVVTVSGFTVLRIDLDRAPGDVAVFSGNAHVEGTGVPGVDVHGGESLTLNAGDPNAYTLNESIEPDSWDAWNSDRDQALTEAAASRTDATAGAPDANNPAWSDLDANGNWYNVPGQGYVWSPYDASSPGWDPYGNGYWYNTPAYGYAWVSGYPWGYMPYSCGAWNWYNTFGWGWAPGGACTPWWGGPGIWVTNIGVAPPHYRYPIRPHHPYNPRPMEGTHAVAQGRLIAVNRGPLPVNGSPLPRLRSGTVTIAGNTVEPLKPIQQTRMSYEHFVPGSTP